MKEQLKKRSSMHRLSLVFLLLVLHFYAVFGATDMNKFFDSSQQMSQRTEQTDLTVASSDLGPTPPLAHSKDDDAAAQNLLTLFKSINGYSGSFFSLLSRMSPHQISERRISHLWPKSLAAFVSNIMSV